ncbi:helix-turn-helix transcriptional regulator [Micromonospora sp. Llam7]|nr:XRE family transcriptional regulator [Micromonospora tarapacensis]MBX7267863.1 helix-turn-helix transcriptional regulator [Micromonospora tarapacensis]
MGAAVGREVRRFREARRMSVSELARRADVSKGTLSRLEAGLGNPTIETIAAIAVALRLPLGDLIPTSVPSAPSLQRGTPAPDYSRQEMLQRIGPGVLTEIWRVRIQQPGNFVESPAHAAGTVEYLLVSRGVLRAGPVDALHEAGAGDFLVFSADVPHRYEVVHGPAEASLVMTYPAMNVSVAGGAAHTGAA